jgi:hypothetical protein
VTEIDAYYESKIFKNSIEANLKFSGILDFIPEINKSKMVLDADQLLMITIYVLLSSNIAMVDMYSHIQLILEFSTDNQKLSQ